MVSVAWCEQHHLKKQAALSDRQFTQRGVSPCHLKGMFLQRRSIIQVITALECAALHHLATGHLCSWRLCVSSSQPLSVQGMEIHLLAGVSRPAVLCFPHFV